MQLLWDVVQSESQGTAELGSLWSAQHNRQSSSHNTVNVNLPVYTTPSASASSAHVTPPSLPSMHATAQQQPHDSSPSIECNAALRDYYAQLAQMEEHNRRCIMTTRAELRRKYGDDRQRRRPNSSIVRGDQRSIEASRRRPRRVSSTTANSNSQSMPASFTGNSTEQPHPPRENQSIDPQAMREFLAQCRKMLMLRQQRRRRELVAHE